MPQININEYDESIFTRVVSDDLVRVVIPGIASFGPTVADSDVDFDSITFTDVNAWQKTFGYTEPEYNPFKDDVSRIYAKQLLDRGAAVTFLRVNTGLQSKFNIGYTTTVGQVASPSETHDDSNFAELDNTQYLPTFTKITGSEPADWSTTYNTYYVAKTGVTNPDPHDENDYVINTDSTYTANKFYSKTAASAPTNWNDTSAPTCITYYTREDNTYRQCAIYTLLTGDSPTGWGTNTGVPKFYTKVNEDYIPVIFTQVDSNTIPAYEANRYYQLSAPEFDTSKTYYTLKDSGKFCPQIAGIEAKYTGSFGNRLLVTFSPVTSQNKSFAYQYSNVSVYRADVTIETIKNETTGIITVNKKITNVHRLESHLVTTNPNDINYFDNENLFKYIRIRGTATAKDELSLIWSNIETNPVPGTIVYSGFPEISLKYKKAGLSTFNSEALLLGGTDFVFSDGTGSNTLMDVLGNGFGGYTVSGTNEKVTVANINRWIWASYKPLETGVVYGILKTIADCYKQYSDPYIYDFDFITAGGFVDETYIIKKDAISSDPSNIISTQEQFNTYLANVDAKVLYAIADKHTVPDNLLQPIHTEMLELVNTRQDCIALIDTGSEWSAQLLPDYVALINSSYATVHAPWCYCNNPYASGTVLMPPSFVFLYTLLSNLINNTEAQKWFPPAGVTRATARIVTKPKYEIGSVILNSWQNDTLSRVNPIMKLKNYGYVIYGQYTAYVAQDEYTHSALESLNVRLISNCVKKQIFNTCLKLTFEPNNSTLWMKFYDAMDKYLLFMKRNDGVYDYRVQMDESTVTTDDINELRCPGKVWINPTRVAESFDIDFILTDAGVTFTDTTGERE